MDDLKWKILKTCCDRLDLTLTIPITYSRNSYFCSIVIDGIFVAATNGDDLLDTINATVTKAMSIIEQGQQTDSEQSEQVSEETIDFGAEVNRIFPVFENFLFDLKNHVDIADLSEETETKVHMTTLDLTPPIDAHNYYTKKSYTTIGTEPRHVTVVKRNMLQSNNIGRKDYIDENNIGFKMLLGLGWEGGPLGLRNGIAEPISVEARTNPKGGLGCVDDQSTSRNITHHNFYNYLKEYADNDEQMEDLEFSTDFYSKEKKKLFGISKELNLQLVSEHRNGILVIKIMKPNYNSCVRAFH